MLGDWENKNPVGMARMARQIPVRAAAQTFFSSIMIDKIVSSSIQRPEFERLPPLAEYRSQRTQPLQDSEKAAYSTLQEKFRTIRCTLKSSPTLQTQPCKMLAFQKPID